MLCLLAAALLLPELDTPALAIFTCLLFLAGMSLRLGRRLIQALASIRALLAAVFIVYLAFTPGPPLIAALPGLSRDGAMLGLHRALLLVDLVLSVALLLHGLAPEALAAGLPLHYFGRAGQRAARQIALCLHATAESAQRLAQLRREGGLIEGLARWCLHIEQAAPDGGADGDLPPTPALRLQHWLGLSGVVAGLYLLGRYT